jgi:hypothetical protein
LDLAKTVGAGPIFSPAPGNIDCAWGAARFRVREQYVPTMRAARDAIRALPKRPDGRGIFGIDDATVVTQRSRLAAEKVANDGLEVFKIAAQELVELREAALESGHTVVAVFHPLDPGEEFRKRGSQEPAKKYVGGPAVASKKMMPVWAGSSWLLLRAVTDTSGPVLLWPVRYRCDPMELHQWLTGDRSGVCAASNPPNIREILVRAAESGQNVAVPARPIGLEWIDDAAEFVAHCVTGGANTIDAAKALAGLAQAHGKDPYHLRWAVQDGFARAELRNVASSWTQYLASVSNPGPAQNPTVTGAGIVTLDPTGHSQQPR